MTNDMTYSEISYIKSDINSFITRLEKYSENYNIQLDQADKSFFIVISKHIIFWKYMYRNNKIGRFYKVLISDGYNYIISIIKREIRYVYVNERSIIENYVRLLINRTLEEDHVTDKIFKEIKDKSYKFVFNNDDYSLIKSEYSISCSYIHGGNALDECLICVFEECIQIEKEFKDKNKYYTRIQRILRLFDQMLVSVYTEEVDGAFLRRKSLLEYLVGKECVEILFV